MSKDKASVLTLFVFPDKAFYAWDVHLDWNQWPVEGFVFRLSETKKDAEYRPATELKTVRVHTVSENEDVTDWLFKTVEAEAVAQKDLAYSVQVIH